MIMSESIYPEVPKKLSYNAIAQLPVISPDMTAQERRKLCVDFFSLYQQLFMDTENGV